MFLQTPNSRLCVAASWPAACLLVGLLVSTSTPAVGQNLQDSGLSLPGVWAGSAAWADYDGDGDTDLVLIGETTEADGSCLRIARILRNDNGQLVEDVTQADRLVGVYFGDTGWADYDNDGDLDLALAGWDRDGAESLRLYLSDAGADVGSREFTLDISQTDEFGTAILEGVRYADLAWGDVDRDGDLDLVVSGMDVNGLSSTLLYTNDRGHFRIDELNSDVFLNVHNGELAWADYDNDGDLDLALAGENVQGSIRRVTELYRNDPTGSFTLDTELSLQTKLSGGAFAWGDYDGDGNIDLAQTGRTVGWSTVLQLYLNRPAGTLSVDQSFALDELFQVDGSVDWIDYDNDGDLDLAASGRTRLSKRRAFVFPNNNGQVSAVSAEPGVEGLAGGATVWGDYNGDGRADLLLTGIDTDGSRETRLYVNSVANANRSPAPPALVNQPIVTGQRALFTWPAAVDQESPVLSYNVRIGSVSGAGDILSAETQLRPGNAGLKTSLVLQKSLSPQVYYWSVQAIDGGLAQSDFADEKTFLVQDFATSDQSFRGMQYSAMSWGDIEGDGDVDLALMGTNRSGDALSLVYVNRDGVLTVDAGSELTPLTKGDLAWGDYDGDGDLDLVTSGQMGLDNRADVLYEVSGETDNLTFRPLPFSLGLDFSSVAWGDIDNDGDLDLLRSGQSAIVEEGVQLSFTVVVVNDGEGGFVGRDDRLEGVNNGDLNLGDIDGDGDLDLVVSGKNSSGILRTDVYRNDLQEGMVDADVDLPGLESSDLALGDYDRDGDLDLVLSGLDAAETPFSGLFDNDGLGQYQANQEVRLPGVIGGDLVWADYDTDEDLDLVLAGNVGRQSILQIWENTIGQAAPDSAFEQLSLQELVGVDRAAIAMADLDGDGDLDLVSSGRSNGAPTTVVNDNLIAASNDPPFAPSGLAATDSADVVRFSWLAGSDILNPPPASLTYSLRVGTSPGGHDIVSARGPQARGNTGHGLDRRVNGLASDTYFWSVQTIDAGFTGSAFAAEQTFIIDIEPPEVASFALNRTAVGLGQTVSLALEIFDAHSGVDPAVVPTVTADIGGEVVEFNTLQFTGNTWNGELTVAEGTPSGVATIVVRGAADGKGNPLAPDSTGTFTVDAVRPTIVNRSPDDQQEDVAAGSGTAIVVGFSEPLDEATVVDANFALRLGGVLAPVSAIYDSAAQLVTIAPSEGLLPGSEYTVEVSSALADLAGNRTQKSDSWTFRTRVPQLLSMTPVSGSTEVLVDDGRIEAVFDTPILRQALQAPGAVEVLREGQQIELREAPLFDEENLTLRFEPTEGLRPGSRYKVSLSGLLGGPLRATSDSGSYSWEFATGVPQVVSLSPAVQDTTVAISDADISVTFDGRLDEQTLAAEGAVLMTREGQQIELREAPLFDEENLTLRFEPTEGLRPGSRYEVTLSGLLGGPLRATSDSGAYSWKFATAIPQVVALTPADQDTVVAVSDAGLTVTFDGELDDQALSADDAVLVTREGERIELRGAPLFDDENLTLRFEPTEGLRPGSRYEVTLSGLLGGPLRAASDSGAYSFRFATAVPLVVALAPVDQDSTVAVGDAAITVTFDGQLDDQALALADAVVVAREGQQIELREAPLFDDENLTLRFEPTEGLRPGSRYEVTLSGHLGGPLRAASDSGAYGWQFATAIPQVVSLSPADRDTLVSVDDATLTVTFDGPLDERALTAAGTVRLFAEGRETPLTTPVFDAGALTLDMTPTAGLRPGTAYRVQIAADVRGPRVQEATVWTFVTEIPRVASTDPADGASIRAGNRRLEVRFSSTVDMAEVHPRNFRLSQAGSPILLAESEFLYDEESFTVSLPPVELVSGSAYRLVLLNRVGGPRSQGEDLDILFTTEVPSVLSTLPDGGSEGVSTGQATLQAIFSGPIARRDGNGFSLRARSLTATLATEGDVPFQIVPVTGFGTDSSLTVVNFAPEGGLHDFTEYEVTINAEVFGDLRDEPFTWRFTTAARLTNEGGGTVTSPDRAVELRLPPNALTANSTEIRIAPLATGVSKPAASMQSNAQIGRSFLIDAGDVRLRKPATLTLRYTAAELGSADPRRLGIFALAGDNWNRIGGTASAAEGMVRTSVDELGVFALFEDLSTGRGAIGLSKVDGQPRAFSPAGGDLGQETDISFELSHPADVTIRVYNAAGRLERIVVRDLPMAPGRNSLPWNGRDEDGDVVASGLYVVVVSAGSAQAEQIVAVVR